MDPLGRREVVEVLLVQLMFLPELVEHGPNNKKYKQVIYKVVIYLAFPFLFHLMEIPQ